MFDSQSGAGGPKGLNLLCISLRLTHKIVFFCETQTYLVSVATCGDTVFRETRAEAGNASQGTFHIELSLWTES